MRLTILPSAGEDLAAAFHFYENQQAGLGDYFRESLIADIEVLRQLAGHHRKVFGFYRVLAKKFPYAIYYSMDAGEICVRSVLDCRRDPGHIRNRLKG
jgi:hypothetical protein